MVPFPSSLVFCPVFDENTPLMTGLTPTTKSIVDYFLTIRIYSSFKSTSTKEVSTPNLRQA